MEHQCSPTVNATGTFSHAFHTLVDTAVCVCGTYMALASDVPGGFVFALNVPHRAASST